MSQLNKVLRVFKGKYVVYPGATSFTPDAWDVYRRFRKGEPLLDGPHIAEYEDALGEYYGGIEAISFGAGRMALYAILKAMDLPEGGEVILPGYTCIVTCNAIRYAGLKPVYVDVSTDDFNMLIESTKAAISQNTQAILAQHTFGIPCDMEALLDISKAHGIPLIEDGAHAIGARWDGKLVGTFGYAGFFSTQGTKMISTERGGYVVTADKRLSEKVRTIQQGSEFCDYEYERKSLLRWCYRAALSGRPWINPRVSILEYLIKRFRLPFYKVLTYDSDEYEGALEGDRPEKYPSRLCNLMSYAGLLQLQRIEEDIDHRRRLVDYLEKGLDEVGIKTARFDHNRCMPSWVRYPFVVKDRNSVSETMVKCGLTPGFWLDDPIHPKGSDYSKNGYVRGMCPNAEYLSDHILNVPVDTRVSVRQLEKWIKAMSRKISNG